MRTIVISDLHLGGGAADTGDDHVYQGRQLIRFIEASASEAACDGVHVELFINGDFLEFAQTLQSAHETRDARCWCSEPESNAKLNAILQGHGEIFDALGAWMRQGHQLTVAAGNHDVDLYWPSVRRALCEATDPALRFEIGHEWVERYEGRLQIAHGHIPDPVNTFANWESPFVRDGAGVDRLAMCPGTLFMVQFVNLMEERYPFADNIQPVQKLAGLLLKEEKSGFFAMAWAFLKFASRYPGVLSHATDGSGIADYGSALIRRIREDDELARCFARLARLGEDAQAIAALRSRLHTEAALAEFILLNGPAITSTPLATSLEPRTGKALRGTGSHVLGTLAKNADFGRDDLRRVARERASKRNAAEVIVMGHTHVRDEFQASGKARYLNPGSWTRNLDVARFPQIRLDDLRSEERFPYALNFVQVDEVEKDAPLRSSLRTFESQPGDFAGAGS